MEPADLAAAWMRMCATGDHAAFGQLTAPGFTCHGPGGTGTAADFLTWLAWYPTAFVGQQPQVDDVLAAGDRVAFRYAVTSTYRRTGAGQHRVRSCLGRSSRRRSGRLDRARAHLRRRHERAVSAGRYWRRSVPQRHRGG